MRDGTILWEWLEWFKTIEDAKEYAEKDDSDACQMICFRRYATYPFGVFTSYLNHNEIYINNPCVVSYREKSSDNWKDK